MDGGEPADDMLTITQKMTITDSSVEGSIEGIPVGKARLFSLSVYDSTGTVQYRGTAEADIAEGSTTRLMLTVIRVPGDAEIPVNDTGAIEETALTVSMDSLAINTYGYDFDFTFYIINNDTVAISLDSAFIVVDSMDTTGWRFVREEGLQFMWRESIEMDELFYWNLIKCDVNRYQLIQDTTQYRMQPLSFTAQVPQHRISFGGTRQLCGSMY